MIHGEFVLLICDWNNAKLDMPQKSGYLCAFSVDILLGQCDSSFLIATNIDS